MLDKERKRRIAYEVIIFLLMAALLCFITRIWIVLFLVLIGILIAALRLLFLSAKTVEVIVPKEVPVIQEKPDTEQDILIRAYSILQRRITESVQIQFPQAKWVWESSNALRNLAESEPLYILLSGAGGYRKVLVQVSNLQFKGLKYESIPDEADIKPDKESEENPEDKKDGKTNECTPKPVEDDVGKVNYEYLAFEWVEANLLSLNNRSNELVAKGQKSLLLLPDELPDEASWQDICAELIRSGFEQAMIVDSGIQVNLPLG